MQKIVIPSVALTSDGATTECFFNKTTFSAVLYTKMKRTYSSTNTTASSGSSALGTAGGYQAWPYAVEVRQVADGGSSVPDCYKMVNDEAGDHVTVGSEAASQTCQCIYENYDS